MMSPELLAVEEEPGHLAACHLRTGEHRHLNPDLRKRPVEEAGR